MNIADTYLNKIEQDELGKLAESPVLLEALRKVLLYDVYYSGVLKAGQPAEPGRNFALGLVANREGVSNEALGADLRGCVEAIRILEGAFKRLSEFKKVVDNTEDKKNTAR